MWWFIPGVVYSIESHILSNNHSLTFECDASKIGKATACLFERLLFVGSELLINQSNQKGAPSLLKKNTVMLCYHDYGRVGVGGGI